MTESILANPSVDRNLKNRFVPEIQKRYAETWKRLSTKATISSERTIEEALDRIRELDDPNHDVYILITGSLHLVSGVLYLLESDNRVLNDNHKRAVNSHYRFKRAIKIDS